MHAADIAADAMAGRERKIANISKSKCELQKEKRLIDAMLCCHSSRLLALRKLTVITAVPVDLQSRCSQWPAVLARGEKRSLVLSAYIPYSYSSIHIRTKNGIISSSSSSSSEWNRHSTLS